MTEKTAKADTEGIPKKLVETAKNTVCRLLAGNPKTFQDDSPTYLFQVRFPQQMAFNFSDESLKGMEDGIAESVNRRPGTSLVENKILTVMGKKVFRSIINMATPGAGRKTVLIQIIQYYLPDGKGAAAISFYTLAAKAKDYLPVFEDAIAQTLK